MLTELGVPSAVRAALVSFEVGGGYSVWPRRWRQVQLMLRRLSQRTGYGGWRSSAALLPAIGWFAPLLRWIDTRIVDRLRRHSRRRFSRAVQVSMLVVLFTALVAASSLIIRSATTDMVRGGALAATETWSELLADVDDDITAILAGDKPDLDALAAVERRTAIPTVQRFRIYDADGRLRFDSREPAAANSYDIVLDDAAPGLTRNILEGASLISRQDGQSASGPAVIYDVFVALKQDGKPTGVLQVAVDQTNINSDYISIAAGAAMKLAVVLSMAFGVPLLGFWVQVRQQDTAERRISFLAERDPLTSLPNRATFRRHVQALMERGTPDHRGFAIHHIDLDQFKSVNDALGQACGDELLRAIARRIRETLRDDDELARLGGDEFAVLQASVSDRASAAALAQRILAALMAPFEVGSERLHISASIGVALAGVDGDSAERLTNAADLALYFAKSNGLARVAFFEPEMHERLIRRRALEQSIKVATEERLFDLHFQPVHAAESERLVGFEALIRLKGSDGEMVSPAEFIPIAEANGLIVEIGKFVLESACRTAATWPAPISVAVNLSPVQFRDGNVVEAVRHALDVSGLSANRLELEVTEGLLLRNSEPVRQQLKALKDLGVAIVLDDFGTGYSSLSYLWQFRFDKIKIDQSFVRALGTNGDVPSILSAIIALGRALKMTILAEGIETPAQAERLRQMGCELFQGYLYSKPVPAAKAGELITVAAANNSAGMFRQYRPARTHRPR